MSAYPLMLDGASLRALVVGAGAVAVRKVRGLVTAGAAVRVVAPSVDATLQDLASSTITILRREYRSEDIGDALLVIAATSSRDVNARVAHDARQRGRLVNVVDAPDEGNCTTAATHRAGDLVVAVSTGRVPSAAARIRDCIAQRFGASYAEAVAELASARSRLLGAADREGWARIVESAVDEHFCERVERGEFSARVATWR